MILYQIETVLSNSTGERTARTNNYSRRWINDSWKRGITCCKKRRIARYWWPRQVTKTEKTMHAGRGDE